MDKTLRTMLLVMLPLGGIIILTLTWLRPVLESERILNTFFGAASIFAVLLRPLFLKILNERLFNNPIPLIPFPLKRARGKGFLKRGSRPSLTPR